MTYNTNVPNASQSPGLFPAQANTNFSRLKTIINADHVFNDTAPVAPNDDGAHRQMTMLARTDPVAPLPNNTNGIMYNKVVGGAAQMYYFNGTNYYLATSILAAVNFDGTGAVGNQTLRSSYNVATVVKALGNIFTINFTNPMPDTNYLVHVSGMAGTTNALLTGSIRGRTNYTDAVTVNSVELVFSATPLCGNVVVMSLT